MKSTRREVEAARLRAEQRIAAATLIDVRRQVHGELYDIELSRLQMLKPSLHLPEGAWGGADTPDTVETAPFSWLTMAFSCRVDSSLP